MESQTKGTEYLKELYGNSTSRLNPEERNRESCDVLRTDLVKHRILEVQLPFDSLHKDFLGLERPLAGEVGSDGIPDKRNGRLPWPPG